VVRKSLLQRLNHRFAISRKHGVGPAFWSVPGERIEASFEPSARSFTRG
jgi:hypothetical protein